MSAPEGLYDWAYAPRGKLVHTMTVNGIFRYRVRVTRWKTKRRWFGL